MKKKLFALVGLFLFAFALNAQTYTIVSRNNQDTIKMYPNSLMGGMKSLVPGTKTEPAQYRLIKKVHQGQESLLFVEFTQVLDKILVAYETNLQTPGAWQVITVNYSDLYQALTRINAIYLEGSIWGMKVQVYQRPSLYSDMVNIDGVEFALPMKIADYENDLIQKAEKEKEKELQRLEKDKKDGYSEQIIAELAAKQENKAYLALLLSKQKFDSSYSSDVKKYFNYAELQDLMRSSTIEQLEKLAVGHSSYFERYEVYR